MKSLPVVTLKYVSDTAQVAGYLDERSGRYLNAVSWMGKATVFSCHEAKAKRIGPSFEQIAERHVANPETCITLAEKIVTGSRGAWGDEVMPAQPELNMEEVREIIDWILSNGQDPAFNYFCGLEGTFRTGKKPIENATRAGYILSAQYTDHGIRGNPGSAKKSRRSAVFNMGD